MSSGRIRQFLVSLFSISCAAVLLVALSLPGCARQFTREHFDQIKPGVDERRDVREILGKPKTAMDDVWYYEDFGHKQHAQVFFDEDGRVISKEWMDAKTGEWEGENPDFDQPQKPEPRQRKAKVSGER